MFPQAHDTFWLVSGGRGQILVRWALRAAAVNPGICGGEGAASCLLIGTAFVYTTSNFSDMQLSFIVPPLMKMLKAPAFDVAGAARWTLDRMRCQFPSVDTMLQVAFADVGAIETAWRTAPSGKLT